MPSAHAVIGFDLDGTLVDNSLRHHWSYAQALEKLGYPALPLGEYWSLKRAATTVPGILTRTAPAEIYPSFRETWLELIECEHALLLDQLFPDTLTALNSVSESYTLGLVSLRRHKRRMIHELGRLGLDGYFSFILSGGTGISAAESRLSKSRLVQQAAIHNRIAAYIGDTEFDVAAARSANVYSVAVSTGIRTRDILAQSKADLLCDRLGEAAAFLTDWKMSV